MKIGEWYSVSSANHHYYCIRILEIETDLNTSGEEEKLLKCFFITRNKEFGVTPKPLPAGLLKIYTKIKDKTQIAKLEKFYKEKSKVTDESKLNAFLDDL